MPGPSAKFRKSAGDGSEDSLKFENPVFGYDVPAEGRGRSYTLFHKAAKLGDYTNFSNAVYEVDGSSIDIHHSEDDTVSSKSLRLWFKEKEARRKYIIVGVVCVVLLAVIVIGVAVGVTMSKENDEDTGRRTAASSSTQSYAVSGSIKFNAEYTDKMGDPDSQVYEDLESKFVEAMDSSVGNSESLKDSYTSTTVQSIESGSILIVYILRFDGEVDDMSKLEESIKSGAASGAFDGIGPVVPGSIVLQSGDKLSTEKPKGTSISKTTTTNPIKTTAILTTAKVMTTLMTTKLTTEIVVDTTTKLTTTATTFPTEQCHHEVIEECADVLDHQYTSRSPEEQRLASTLLLATAQHTADCFGNSKWFVCHYIAPECGDSYLGGQLFPCKHMCQDYWSSCKYLLDGIVGMEQILDCDIFPEYSPGYANQDCVSKGAAPSSTPTPTPETNSMVCHPMHHTYCHHVPWNTTFHPNFFNMLRLQDSYTYLSFMEAVGDNGFACHDDLRLLVCSVILPKCGTNYNRVPPCKSLCSSVVQQCGHLLAQLPIPIPLSCSAFPDTECIAASSEAPPERHCVPHTQYTCLNGACISTHQRCNGYQDCLDGSDERGCANITSSCEVGESRCAATGICMPAAWQCDNFNDCGDQSDEQNCVCADHQHDCVTSTGLTKCINATQKCDGFSNCFNRSDEINCDNHTCIEGQFSCANGNCRPQRYVCDGDDDCLDGSDEKDCLANESCADEEFKCTNGTRRWGSKITGCIPTSWQCDREPDCSDSSDESGCPSLCDPNPCKHGGNCTADEKYFACICPPGTGGQYCQISTELPDYSCHNEITVSECKDVLAPYHNGTNVPLLEQARLSNILAEAAVKLQNCSNMSMLTMCQYALPDCGTGIGFPNFPCRHMCEAFKHDCSHELRQDPHLNDFIQCDHLFDKSYADAECFSVPDVTPSTNSNFTGHRCEYMNNHICSNLTDYHYNTTSMPNLFHQYHQGASYYLIEQFNVAHTDHPRCHDSLMHFACSAFLPPCSMNGSRPVPPCKSLCQSVSSDCGYWLAHVQWNLPIDCDSYPESTDPDVCVPLPSTSAPANGGCHGDQFQCGSGECIHQYLLCDDFVLCADGSDEDESICRTIGCEGFTCPDGTCIARHWVCDTDFDCPHETDTISADELNCVCDPITQIRCANGVGCVPNEFQCDGYFDCSDRSDEHGCDVHTCSDDQWPCKSDGQCIQERYRCDNFNDCVDSSDEEDCESDLQDCDGTTRLCANGTNTVNGNLCVPLTWVCDGAEDCTDGSDEAQCSPCRPNPCIHGGECSAIGPHYSKHAQCTCAEGTTGLRCEQLLEAPAFQCHVDISLSTCTSVLAPYYNKTRIPAHHQEMLRHGLLNPSLLNRYNQCSPLHAEVFLCGSTLAGCQDNGLPILPCKHTCLEFTHGCAEDLTDANLQIDCSVYPDSSIYPDTICLSTVPLPTPSPDTTSSPPQCVENKIEWCRDIGINKTTIPNLLSQTSLVEANVYASMLQHLHANYPLCSDALRVFSCALLTPDCTTGNTSHSVQLPCKSTCEIVVRDCTYALDLMQLPLPFVCSELPETECVKYSAPYVPQTCAPDQFTCENGACIPGHWRCNLYLNCPDGDDSDERDCPPVTCDPDQFQCSNGRCIPPHWLCDDSEDCSQGEDEVNCTRSTCNVFEYACLGGGCIANRKRCDGTADCDSGDDEEECDSVTCDNDEFQCNSGTCIPILWKCDDMQDCPNDGGEDEAGCDSEVTCEPGYFKCEAGAIWQDPCLPPSSVCDHEEDCLDGADEICGNTDCPLTTRGCDNGGTCTLVQGSPVCSCPQEYTGAYCTLLNLPDYKCDYPIQADGCTTHLPYNGTSTKPTIQAVLANSTSSLLSRLEGCYDQAEMFICASRYPTCQANGFPLFPCRDICHLFKSRCSNKLTELGETDLLNIDCDLFAQQVNEHFTCLSDAQIMPTQAPPETRDPSNGTCQPLTNHYCTALGYNITSFPNFMKQTTQLEAEYFINEVMQLHTGSTCRQYMHTVACAVFFPNCTTSGPLPPCKSTCEEATNKCSYWFHHYQLTAPFLCHDFPDSTDPSVCMKVIPLTDPNIPTDCTTDQRVCKRSSECVRQSDWCNSRCDCSDCSDETDCQHIQCTEDQFACDNRAQCIPANWQCDSHDDCEDKSDEKDCQTICDDHQMLCPESEEVAEHCIPGIWKCDGEVDCEGSDFDEADCDCISADMFACDNKCIPHNWVCDDHNDCVDGMDESNCTVPSTGDTDTNGCVEISDSYCLDKLSQRETAQFPNTKGHTSEDDASALLTAIANSTCTNSSALSFACTTLLPQCGLFGPQYPCKTWCEAVAVESQCSTLMSTIIGPDLSCESILYKNQDCVNSPVV